MERWRENTWRSIKTIPNEEESSAMPEWRARLHLVCKRWDIQEVTHPDNDVEERTEIEHVGDCPPKTEIGVAGLYGDDD